MKNITLNRRDLLKSACATSLALHLLPYQSLASSREKINRIIQSSGEKLSIIGLGTSRTLDVDLNPDTTTSLVKVMQTFFDMDGQLIDSSPMYGNAENVVGKLLEQVSNKNNLFAATKVWTFGKEAGISQMNKSMELMGVDKIDLMQIHNLRDWKIHINTLRKWKDSGKIRYIGITTSHGRFHEELESIMQKEKLDFVQFSYNIEDRETENRLLPLAADKGIATLINRPYQRGSLFHNVKGKSLPDWASDIDCSSWGQYFLKFIAAHPAVTCIIPATSKLKHMVDNMGANYGNVPDEKMRQEMLRYYESM